MTKKIIDWIIYSSADPKKISLTIKGLIPMLVGMAVLTSNVFKFSFDQNVFQESLVQIADLAVTLLTWLSTGITIYGACRKVFLTVLESFK